MTLVLFSLFSLFTMGSAMDKSKHVFFMGALVENQILQPYLKENCNHQRFQLCSYIDSMPTTFNDFVWKDNSPLYKMGGWNSSKTEFKQIIQSILSSPKYLLLLVAASVKSTFKQCRHYDIGDGNAVFMQGTVLYDRINKYFPREASLYTQSKQNKAYFQQTLAINLLFKWVIGFSVLVLLLVMINHFHSINLTDLWMIALTILFIILTAWGSATFSMVADRFGCKVMWLLTFLAILWGWKYKTNHPN